MWQPDGAGTRARIGVLTPHLDPVPESEFNALAPPGVSIHAARVPLGMVAPDGRIVPHVGSEVARAFAEPPHVDAAAASLAALAPSAIVYAFTSSSYILGAQADAELAQRLSKAADGTPVVVQTAALAAALRALGVGRIALIHPPWFAPEVDALGAEYFRALGFAVVAHGPAKLRSDYGDIAPQQVHDWVRSRVPGSAEAAVIGGGGFRAIGAIEALEAALGRPVLSANQAAFWYALRLSGVTNGVSGFGRIFALDRPEA